MSAFEHLLVDRMDVLAADVTVSEAGEAVAIWRPVRQGVPCSLQPGSVGVEPRLEQVQAPARFEVYFDPQTLVLEIDGRHRVRVGLVGFRVLAVNAGRVDGWPGRMTVEKLAEPTA